MLLEFVCNAHLYCTVAWILLARNCNIISADVGFQWPDLFRHN